MGFESLLGVECIWKEVSFFNGEFVFFFLNVGGLFLFV